MKLKTTLLSLAVFSALGVAAQQENSVQGQTLTVTSSIPFQGYEETAAYNGVGEYAIYYDNVNQQLDKPIFLVDGFDPTNTRTIPMIYDQLNYGSGQNLATDLRNQGFDIVILNFPNYTRTETNTLVQGGSDYIQRNAFVLVELINMINGMKSGDEQNVVIGPSMGGLIARYALRYMEMNSMDHETRLYVSFDAPHHGANIPIGFQHLFNYMASGPLGDATLQVIVNAMLKSPASRQMLIDQFEGHLQSGSATEFNPAITLPTGKPGFRDAFQAELDAMGFPQQTRNVSISNGSNTGLMTNTPGMEVMDHEFYTSDSQRAIIELNFTPAAGQTAQVSRFRGQVNVFVWLTVTESAASSQSPATSSGLDTSPGGMFDVSSLEALAGSNALLTEFFDNLTTSVFTFIPTLSSLAVDNANWYAPVASASQTPFDAFYAESGNTNHVTLTPGNTAFVLNEILEPLATEEQLAAGIRVLNPVTDKLMIQSTMALRDVVVTVSDVNGKTLQSVSLGDMQGSVEIPVSMAGGLYFVRIDSKEGTAVYKMLKR